MTLQREPPVPADRCCPSTAHAHAHPPGHAPGHAPAHPHGHSPVDASWLALREAADTRARDAGGRLLLTALGEHLARRGEDTVHVVDVGAGTGANRRYLAPRLPVPQRWTAVDLDAELLGHPGHGDARRVRADVADLRDVVADVGAPTLVTCSALLDVLSRYQLEALADTVAADRCAALLALTVTGEVAWDPADPDDLPLAAVFDAHQQRGGRPGPAAAQVLTGLLEERGLRVTSADTPWHLGPDHAPLLRRWLDERVEATWNHDPAHPASPGALARWHARRREQLAAGDLHVRVDHVDLLVTPWEGP